MSDRRVADRTGRALGAAGAIGGRFAKLVARVVGAAAGLGLLAFIGHTAVAGAVASSGEPGAPSASAAASASQPSAPAQPVTAGAPPVATAPSAGSAGSGAPSPSTARASAEDPVFLNAASEADLRRLPGIGAKRAGAIVELRARVGRFRALEDLLKVKGIGRAMLRRLRPLLRIDPPPGDGGAR